MVAATAGARQGSAHRRAATGKLLPVGLKLIALSTHVLASYFRLQVKSHEASAKYFVLGAMSSGVLLYGLPLVYGKVGTLDLAGMAKALGNAKPDAPTLVGLVAVSPAGVQSVLLYMLVYTVTNLGAFGFVVLLESKGHAGETVQDYAGLARKHPAAAFGMLLFLLSLAGIPPTAGFMGKLYLFAAAVNAGYVWLVVLAVLMSAVSLYYYFRIAMQMYLREPEAEPAEMLPSPLTERVIWLCGAAVLLIGVWPAPFLDWARVALGVAGR
jgi:NADH:ubiquinone oxidoreductase subunit 2 (subunit N)